MGCSDWQSNWEEAKEMQKQRQESKMNCTDSNVEGFFTAVLQSSLELGK